MKIFDKIAKKPVGAFIPISFFGKKLLEGIGIIIDGNHFTAPKRIGGVYIEESGMRISLQFVKMSEYSMGFDGFRINEKKSV